MECLSFGIRSLALAQAYRRLDVTRALDQHISTDLLELVSAPMLQRHAITATLHAARKEAAETLSHLYEIARQDCLLGLDMLRVPGPGGPVQILMRQCFMQSNHAPIRNVDWASPPPPSDTEILAEARTLIDSVLLD